MTTGTYDAFISYASPDRALAEELYRRLTAEDFNVWFDKARLEPGFDWHREIEQGCEQSRVLLPVLTPRWLKSDWTRFETYGAEAIIPLVYEGPRAEVMTPPLERWQPARLDMDGADEAVWARLFAAIRRCLAEPPPEKEHRVTHLHYLANPYFTGREAQLVEIHEELHRNPTAALTQGRVRAIAALGGAGKTTLARHYAEKYWRCYPQIFWMDCRNGLQAEFAHIYELLFPDRPDIGLKEPDKAALVLHALNDLATRLLVLDNAEDEESIMEWIPKTGGCHTLITSRFSGFSAAIKTIYLYVLEKEPSVQFLQKRARRVPPGPELSACEHLAERLGYLPLALEQAGAYIREQGDGFGFEKYLHLYEEATLELLESGALGSTEYPNSVVTTWKPTIAKLTPLARAILRLCAFFAETPIAVDVLTAGIGILRGYAQTLFPQTAVASSGSAELAVRKALALLKAYSMIRLEGQSLRIHPLLQTVEVLTQRNDVRRESWQQATELLCVHLPAATWKDDCRLDWTLADYQRWGQLLHHIKSMQRHQLQVEGATPSPTFLGAGIGAYATQEDFDSAIPIAQDLCGTYESGDRSADAALAAAAETLAYLLKQSHRDQDALIEFKKVEKLLLRLNGADDAATMRAQHNVACLLKRLDDLPAAESIMRDVLERRMRVLGSDHYDTATSIHDLGWLLMEKQDCLAEAERLLNEGLDKWKRTLQPANPDIRAAASNLAHLYRKQKRYTEAVSVQRDLLSATQAVLGEDHLDCFGLKHNLSLFVFYTGRFDESLAIIEDVVAGYRRYLPPDHRDMLTAIQDLGTGLGKLKRLDEAEALLREALSGYERTQGNDTTDTWRTIVNLAGVLKEKGNYAEAETLYRRSLESRERTLGATHADALASRDSLASLLHDKGDWTGAEEQYRQGLDWRIATLGLTHLDTLGNANNLAVSLQAKGDLEEAEDLFRQALDGLTAALGPEHPDTLSVLGNMAALLSAKGDLVGAETLFRRAMDGRERALGSEHPDTLASLQSLADVLDKTGRTEEAKPLRLRRIETIAAKTDTPPLDLRTAALDAYCLGDYALAKSLLERVQGEGFEVPGTHAHLARIALVTGDAPGAASHAAQAWAHRTDAPPYVPPRILWLQLAARLLTPAHSPCPDPPVLLGRLKTALQTEGAQMEWTMDPVLDRLKPELSADDHALLTALVAALSFPDRVAALDELLAWRAAAPQPLE